MKDAAANEMCGVLGYEEKPLVSTDYINDTRSGDRGRVVHDGRRRDAAAEARSSVFTLVPIRPRSRGELHSLRTFSPGVVLSAQGPLAFNPDDTLDAFQLRF